MRLGLEPDVQVVGEAGDGGEAIALAERLRPDVVLMDVTMPHVDGITATRVLRATVPGSAVVMLSLHDDAITQRQARDAGAAAFIAKHSNIEHVLAAIRAAAGPSPDR